MPLYKSEESETRLDDLTSGLAVTSVPASSLLSEEEGTIKCQRPLARLAMSASSEWSYGLKIWPRQKNKTKKKKVFAKIKEALSFKKDDTG